MTGLSRGFGYVNFAHREDAEKAINKLNGYGYNSLSLQVEWSTPRPNYIYIYIYILFMKVSSRDSVIGEAVGNPGEDGVSVEFTTHRRPGRSRAY